MFSTKKDHGDHPIPDSTTKEKSPFLLGDEVLMERSDGNFYLGVIIEINIQLEQCLVKFDDNTDSWSNYSSLTKLSAGVKVSCVKCKSSESGRYNSIIVCDRCSRGYHQLCHMPQIKKNDLNCDLKWQCTRCLNTPEKRQLPIRKNSLPTKVTVKPDFKRDFHLKLPYNWDVQHRINKENIYCYCGKSGKWFLQMLPCCRCRQWFHGRCIESLKSPLFFGDRFYVFVCKLCNTGSEFLRRLELKWVDLVHLCIFNLILKKGKKYLEIEEIMEFLNINWELLQLPQKINEKDFSEIKEAVVNTLMSNRNRFKHVREKKRVNYWGLKVRVPPPIPIFNLPPNNPICDTVLAEAWKNSARLKFLPFNPKFSKNPKDFSQFPDWETKDHLEELIGLNLLQVEFKHQTPPPGVSSSGLVCIKSASPSAFPDSRAQVERRIKSQSLESDGIYNYKERKAKMSLRNSEKVSNTQDLPPTPPSSESNPEGGPAAQQDTSGDETSSRGTLDLIIPPPVDFEGRNNPFLNGVLQKNNVVKPLKRRLSEKEILAARNGEIKRKKTKRAKLNSRSVALLNETKRLRRRSAPAPSINIPSPTSSPVKNSIISIEQLKSTVNLYFGGVNRIASGEQFSVRAKRITPDGKIQYLINWGCSAPSKSNH